MRLNIPYYAQTSEFTCGPACLLMVLKFLDPRIRLSRSGEFALWRQCNMIGIRGADPFGMSIPLLEAGCEVLLLTQRSTARCGELRYLRMREHGFTDEDVALALFGMADNRRRARERGLPVSCTRVTVGQVEEGFRKGRIPIVLVHMGLIHQFEIPHWVVVTGAGEGSVTFHDPYPPKGGRHLRVSSGEFEQMIDQVGSRLGHNPSVLLVGSRLPAAAAGAVTDKE